jgi:hypothetical protein
MRFAESALAIAGLCAVASLQKEVNPSALLAAAREALGGADWGNPQSNPALNLRIFINPQSSIHRQSSIPNQRIPNSLLALERREVGLDLPAQADGWTGGRLRQAGQRLLQRRDRGGVVAEKMMRPRERVEIPRIW